MERGENLRRAEALAAEVKACTLMAQWVSARLPCTHSGPEAGLGLALQKGVLPAHTVLLCTSWKRQDVGAWPPPALTAGGEAAWQGPQTPPG